VFDFGCRLDESRLNVGRRATFPAFASSQQFATQPRKRTIVAIASLIALQQLPLSCCAVCHLVLHPLRFFYASQSLPWRLRFKRPATCMDWTRRESKTHTRGRHSVQVSQCLVVHPRAFLLNCPRRSLGSPPGRSPSSAQSRPRISLSPSSFTCQYRNQQHLVMEISRKSVVFTIVSDFANRIVKAVAAKQADKRPRFVWLVFVRQMLASNR